MLSTHPLQGIPAYARPKVFVALLLLTVLVMAVFALTGAPLTTSAAPLGIVSLELAGNAATAERILASWDDNTRLRAAFGLGIDYLYMPLYSTTIGLACVWAAEALRRRRWPFVAAGSPLAWGLWLAALADAIENVALATIMFHGVAEPWPQVSFWCASVKFALIILGLLYAAFGAVSAISSRMRRA